MSYVYELSEEIVYGDDPDTMSIEEGPRRFYRTYDIARRAAMRDIIRSYVRNTKQSVKGFGVIRPVVCDYTMQKIGYHWITVTWYDEYDERNRFGKAISRIPVYNEPVE